MTMSQSSSSALVGVQSFQSGNNHENLSGAGDGREDKVTQQEPQSPVLENTSLSAGDDESFGTTSRSSPSVKSPLHSERPMLCQSPSHSSDQSPDVSEEEKSIENDISADVATPVISNRATTTFGQRGVLGHPDESTDSIPVISLPGPRHLTLSARNEDSTETSATRSYQPRQNRPTPTTVTTTRVARFSSLDDPPIVMKDSPSLRHSPHNQQELGDHVQARSATDALVAFDGNKLERRLVARPTQTALIPQWSPVPLGGILDLNIRQSTPTLSMGTVSTFLALSVVDAAASSVAKYIGAYLGRQLRQWIQSSDWSHRAVLFRLRQSWVQAAMALNPLTRLIPVSSNKTLSGRRDRIPRQREWVSSTGDDPSRRSRRSVRGLANYGQTCFLNAVLQSLASLEAFVEYLEQVVSHAQTTQEDLSFSTAPFWRKDDDDRGEKASDPSDLIVSDRLLTVLHAVNGIVEAEEGIHKRIDPRPILQGVGQLHPQFRSKFGGHFSHISEQQDAQELLQALLGVVVRDAKLESSSSVSHPRFLEQAFISEDGRVRFASTYADNSSVDVDFETVEEQDEVLTVVSVAKERQMLKKERKNRKKLIELNASRGSDIKRASPGADPSSEKVNMQTSPQIVDEKKMDDFSIHVPRVNSEESLFSECQESVDVEGSRTNINATCRKTRTKKSPPLTSAMRMIFSSTTSTTPSPLCGWMGSALQCRDCKHVRPIQNAPFVDIPVVPIAVSRILSMSNRHSSINNPCTLEECLAEFTSIERVNDVECRCCTYKREVANLEEEVGMLQGGIQALSSRARRQGSTSSDADPAKHLRHELISAIRKLRSLQSVSPDEDGAMEGILGDPSSPSTTDDGDLHIHRSDAFKCLLLTRLPSVLCIHVQRRYYDPLADRMTKTSQHVIFPEYLDVGPYCAYGSTFGPESPWAGSPPSKMPGRRHAGRPIVYRLMAAIEHRGGAFAGHYICYRRDPVREGSWLFISDETVKACDLSVVKKCQAYMLFYEAV